MPFLVPFFLYPPPPPKAHFYVNSLSWNEMKNSFSPADRAVAAAGWAGPSPAVSSAPITACPRQLLNSGWEHVWPGMETSHLFFHKDQLLKLKLTDSSLRDSASERTKGKSLPGCMISSEFFLWDRMFMSVTLHLSTSNVYHHWNATCRPNKGRRRIGKYLVWGRWGAQEEGVGYMGL